MDTNLIQISPILTKLTTSPTEDEFYTFCWIKDGIEYIEINNIKYDNVSNSVFFLAPNFHWNIHKKNEDASSGYVLHLPKSILNHPTFKNLHVTQVRLFKSSDEIPKINLAPGIEKRIQSILEMLDELVSTNLKHREEAILSLLNTFFVYCDGKCNIKTILADNNSKAALVYKFRKLLDSDVSQHHEVKHYAESLSVSSKYLNECVKEILAVNAKHLIVEQLIMQSRHRLKFTDKTVKEICYDLGFSSPDYFSTFLKRYTGMPPSQLRSN